MRGPIATLFGSFLIAISILACGGNERLSPVGTVDHASSASSAGASGTGSAGSGGAGGAGGGGEGGATLPKEGIIVGVTSGFDPRNPLSLHVILRVNGAVVDEQTYGPEGAQPFVSPLELVIGDLPAGDEVDVDLAVAKYNGVVVLSRLASTSVVAGKLLLLRLHLTEDCTAIPPPCEAPLTCVRGACRDTYAPPSNLEVYSPSWPSYSYCKPEVAGAPVLLLGTGRLGYTPINDFDVLTMAAGDQGGFHIWMAVRMRNLRQMSNLTFTGHLTDLGLDVYPFTSTREFGDDATTGYCERVGIAFQLDETVAIDDLLGMAMQVTATITDEDGATAEDMKTIAISETIDDE